MNLHDKRVPSASFNLSILTILLATLFAWSVQFTESIHRKPAADEMRVRLPIPLQISFAFGDQFLAANLSVFRAVIVGTGELDKETMHVLGTVQEDAATMNPQHEDNYYLAAAILPWGGEVAASTKILTAATEARTSDALPPFFLGFITQYFVGDFRSAANWVEVAASRSSGGNKEALHALAAKWYEKAADPKQALTILRTLASQTRDQRFRGFLERRAGRVEGLIVLRKAHAAYIATYTRPPTKLGDLLGFGGLSRLPVDPTGIGYQLDAHGLPILAPRPIPPQ